jgi:hypothetical protein
LAVVCCDTERESNGTPGEERVLLLVITKYVVQLQLFQIHPPTPVYQNELALQILKFAALHGERRSVLCCKHKEATDGNDWNVYCRNTVRTQSVVTATEASPLAMSALISICVSSRFLYGNFNSSLSISECVPRVKEAAE